MDFVFTLSLVLFGVVAFVLVGLVYVIFRPLSGPSPFNCDTRQTRKPIECNEEKRRNVLKVGYLPERIPQRLDAVIVGSGLGGLVAGALLTKAGKRVCVFEQHDQAGGCLHTFMEGGFEFDTGIHYVGEMLSNGALRFLLDQVRIHHHPTP
jgi:all-trans-retinol 13,14-reductase